MLSELHRRWRHFLGRFNGQAYYWTREWQAIEREAEADIAAGRVAEFATAEDLYADLFGETTAQPYRIFLAIPNAAGNAGC